MAQNWAASRNVELLPIRVSGRLPSEMRHDWQGDCACPRNRVVGGAFERASDGGVARGIWPPRSRSRFLEHFLDRKFKLPGSSSNLSRVSILVMPRDLRVKCALTCAYPCSVLRIHKVFA